MGHDSKFGGLAKNYTPAAEGNRIGKIIARDEKEIMMLANNGVLIGPG